MGTMPSRRIAYYISAHGYGHGVRSCDVIRAVHRLYPEIGVVVVTDLPAPFLKNRISSGNTMYRAGAFDVGMVQLDSIRVDVDATLGKLDALYARKDELIARERSFLRDQGIGAVVSDIPAIPMEAAKATGIPAVAAGNLCWDWIYSIFVGQDPRWEKYVREFRASYGKADVLLRYPFHGDMSAFPNPVDIPVLASPGRSRREEMTAMTGCSPSKKWVLLSFTTLDWDEQALRAVGECSEYEFFTIKPLEWRRKNIHPIDREVMPFTDVLASVDAVITKPGFGVISECLVNRKPMIYADRSDFIEYEVLVRAIEKYLKHLHIPSERLYAGDVKEYVDRVWSCPEPAESLSAGGDVVAAGQIIKYLRPR